MGDPGSGAETLELLAAGGSAAVVSGAIELTVTAGGVTTLLETMCRSVEDDPSTAPRFVVSPASATGGVVAAEAVGSGGPGTRSLIEWNMAATSSGNQSGQVDRPPSSAQPPPSAKRMKTPHSRHFLPVPEGRELILSSGNTSSSA